MTLDVDALLAQPLASTWTAARTTPAAPLAELPPADAGIVAALGDPASHQGRKWTMLGPLGGLLRGQGYTRAECESLVREWLETAKASDPSCNVANGVKRAAAAWYEHTPKCEKRDDDGGRCCKPALTGFRGLVDALGEEHAELVSQAAYRARNGAMLAYAERAAARAAARFNGANVGHVQLPPPPDPFAALGSDPGLDAACAPLDWLIEGLGLAPGKISLITAYAGGSKTPTAALMSVCVAAGVPCLGHDVRRARVLYLAAEGGRVARRKTIRIARGLGVDVHTLVADGWLKILNAEALNEDRADALKGVIESHNLGLVVIDTVSSALRSAGTSRNDEAYARLLWDLGKISEDTRCTVLGLAHDSKSASGSDLRGTSGTASIVEAAQTVIRLEPDRDDHTLVRISCVRAPDDRFSPFGVRWVDGEERPRFGKFSGLTAARTKLDVSLPLRCVLDSSAAITDRRGVNTTNEDRAAKKTVAMLAAAPRVLDALKCVVGCKRPELIGAAGDVSARGLNEVLARLAAAGAITRQGDWFTLAWKAWPSAELKVRVDELMSTPEAAA